VLVAATKNKKKKSSDEDSSDGGLSNDQRSVRRERFEYSECIMKRNIFLYHLLNAYLMKSFVHADILIYYYITRICASHTCCPVITSGIEKNTKHRLQESLLNKHFPADDDRKTVASGFDLPAELVLLATSACRAPSAHVAMVSCSIITFLLCTEICCIFSLRAHSTFSNLIILYSKICDFFFVLFCSQQEVAKM
jgi:hypothetical protein